MNAPILVPPCERLETLIPGAIMFAVTVTAIVVPPPLT